MLCNIAGGDVIQQALFQVRLYIESSDNPILLEDLGKCHTVILAAIPR
jgi:hypothetical protein